MNSIAAWMKLPGTRMLILLTNLVYIISILLKIYLSNPEYFLENAFQTVNLLFYLYVLLTYLFIKNVKLYFLSSFLLILDLPVNFKSGLQHFLAYQLHMGSPLLIHFAFFMLLALLVLLVYRYNTAEYLQIFLLFFYIVSLFVIAFQTQRIHSSRLKISSPVSSITKNYYFLLFDEYPNEQVMEQYKLCDKSDYPSALLSKEGFIGDQNSWSNYISTVRSTTNMLTGNMQEKYNVNNAIHALDSNVFAHGNNYSFQAFSILDDQNRPNSLFSRYYFYNFNTLLTDKIIPRLAGLFSKRGFGEYTDCDAYNADALAKLVSLSKTSPAHVAYIHFFTPHAYPLVLGQPESQRIHSANQWMLKAVRVLTGNDPKAGVIIFSDHGLREQYIPLKLWNRNLLYYRNVVIDTGLINKNGLVDLVRSIKY
jgi:hypothetical protein